jgi:hypothetical protein
MAIIANAAREGRGAVMRARDVEDKPPETPMNAHTVYGYPHIRYGRVSLPLASKRCGKEYGTPRACKVPRQPSPSLSSPLFLRLQACLPPAKMRRHFSSVVFVASASIIPPIRMFPVSFFPNAATLARNRSSLRSLLSFTPSFYTLAQNALARSRT